MKQKFIKSHPGNIMWLTLALAVLILSVARLAAAQNAATQSATTPRVMWARQFTGDKSDETGNQRAESRFAARSPTARFPRVLRGVDADGAGGAFVGGSFLGSVKSGDKQIESAGGNDMLAARFDDKGSLRWLKRFGGAGSDYIYDVVTDSRGNPVIVGMFSNGARFDDFTPRLAGGTDAFTAKLDANGKVLWVQTAGGARPDGGNEVAVDGQDNVLVVGNSYGAVQVGDTRFTYQGGMDSFIVKYRADGRLMWARQIAGRENEQGRGIIADAKNNVFVTGEFTSAIGIEGNQLRAASGECDIFIAKYSPDGRLTWAKRFGAKGADYSRGIGTDKRGNIYVAGVFSGIVEFDSRRVQSGEQSRNLFLVKLNPRGDVLWARAMTSRDDAEGCEIEVDANGNSYLSGQFGAELKIGEEKIKGSGGRNLFAAKFDAEGQAVWIKSVKGTSAAINFALALHEDNSLTLVGAFNGELDFDEHELKSSEGMGAFVATLAAN